MPLSQSPGQCATKIIRWPILRSWSCNLVRARTRHLLVRNPEHIGIERTAKSNYTARFQSLSSRPRAIFHRGRFSPQRRTDHRTGPSIQAFRLRCCIPGPGNERATAARNPRQGARSCRGGCRHFAFSVGICVASMCPLEASHPPYGFAGSFGGSVTYSSPARARIRARRSVSNLRRLVTAVNSFF
jgi:hypothetical protein